MPAYDNAAIAPALDEFGDLLEIAAAIESLVKSGEFPGMDEVTARVPASVVELRTVPGVIEAEYEGRIRRMKETVGDIDVLVASHEGPAVMEAVRGLAFVSGVIASGDTKTSVMTTSGRQADVRVVEPECWGAALQYFTGSAEHNVHLRENVGEIELALEGRTPDLVTVGEIRSDLHSHTIATDGRSTLEQNRARARELGYEYLGCSDNAYELRMVGGLSMAEIEEQWERIDDLNALDDGGSVLLESIELNIDDDGGVDQPDEFLARFDHRIASLHHGFNQPREQATRRLLAAMDNPYVVGRAERATAGCAPHLAETESCVNSELPVCAGDRR